MLIAKNDEKGRSRLWRIVITASSVVIVLIAVFFLYRMFTVNPLEGTWKSQDSDLVLAIEDGDTASVALPEIGDRSGLTVRMNYTFDRKAKTVTFEEDPSAVAEAAEKSGGQVSEEAIRGALANFMTAFSYSVDQRQLTLTEREYGEQMVFDKQ